jgi:hypothetical protein
MAVSLFLEGILLTNCDFILQMVYAKMNLKRLELASLGYLNCSEGENDYVYHRKNEAA